MTREQAITLADELTQKGAMYVRVHTKPLAYTVDQGEVHEWNVSLDVDDMRTEHMREAIGAIEARGHAGVFEGSILRIS